nr:reverse transcriptase domain-containing protein [Tanacetum cinerariifolium]
MLHTHRLALRYSADYSSSDHFTSDDTSQDNSSNSLSKTSSDSHSNTSSDSSLRHSSSVYLILDSPCDLPTATFVGPSRKRCRSLTSSMPIASAIPGSLSPVRADLLLPRKWFKDFDSADINACIAFVDDVAARGTDVRVKVGTTAVEEADPSARGTIKIGVDRVTHHVVLDDTVESVTKDLLELVSADGSLEDCGDQPAERAIIMPTATRFEMTQDAINELIAKRVEEALKAYDTARNLRTEMEMKDDQQDDNVEANGDNGNGNDNVNGNPNVNNRGVVPINRECTYQDFLKFQPLNFKGTEGVVALTHWFEKMETVLHISNCLPRYQVKYASCTLLDGALTWWNSHKRIVGVDVAYTITWKALMRLMTEDAIRIANNLMDQKLKGYVVKNAENKRRLDNNPSDNRGQQQQPFKSKNKTGNKTRNNEGKARAYAIRGGGGNPNSNVVTELGSFDVIIGMDWLAKYHPMIVCDEKIVHIPYGDEVLIIKGDGCNGQSKSKLSITSCTKTQKYIQKGYQVYLA